eukprot:TRINITY_DN2801_c1_g1_i3.p2 TRINITY_DN2801_c1_g1~~TRINITY_DN2801_c1_g1_i3.p2  ORF type:complete len:151 (-),score=23.58 TRINITY_DN2801_c1_g1_i3:33-485(-)
MGLDAPPPPPPPLPAKEAGESSWSVNFPSVVGFQPDALVGYGVEFVDLIAAAGCVVGKPGYGMCGECVANRTPMLVADRSEFAESALLVEFMKQHIPCAVFDATLLAAGAFLPGAAALAAWTPAQWQALGQCSIGGATVIADELRRLVHA